VGDDFEGYFTYVRKTYGNAYDAADLRRYLKKTYDRRNKSFEVYPFAVRNYLKLMVKWEDFKQAEIDSISDSKLFDLAFLPRKTNP
jgi:hypothetical protein